MPLPRPQTVRVQYTRRAITDRAHYARGQTEIVPAARASQLIRADIARILGEPWCTDGRIVGHADHYPLDPYARVNPLWIDGTAVCIATGPSLTAEQVGRTYQSNVIAVNDAYTLAPHADVLYFADTRWWQWHRERPAFRDFKGVRVTVEQTGGMVEDEQVLMLRNLNNDGAQCELSTRSDGLATGMNSGYQAINLAYLTGAKRILLLGYDMQPVDGRAHFFGDHPDRIQTSEATFTAFRVHYQRLARELKRRGVEVINCSPVSALKCFPYAPLESLLPAA